jgi:hypothetical protein
MLAVFDGLVCSRHARNFRSPEGRLCRPDNLDVHQVASGGGREGGLPCGCRKRVGAENLIRPCEQDEWIEAMEWVNSILAMSGDVVAAQTHDPTLGRTR